MRFNVEHPSLPRKKDFEKFCEIDDWNERSLKKFSTLMATKFSRQNFRAKIFAPKSSRQIFRAKIWKNKKDRRDLFFPDWMGEM